MTRTRRRREPSVRIDGWLVIDKPGGMTSTAVCNQVRRLAGGVKAGHGGTLDPLATGILPIALGEATKTVAYTMEARKTYRFRVRWGEARDTDDADGAVVATHAYRPTRAAVETALPGFVGAIEQVPPAYSAIKIDGERAYARARRDEVVTIQPRIVSVERFRLVDMPDADHADFEVECGKGTYMRSLARDLALSLGTVGHIAVLRRTAVGPFGLDRAIALESLEALGHIAPDSEGILPVETALADIPALAVTGSEAAALRSGRVLQLFSTPDLARIGDFADGTTLRAIADGKLVAVARYESGQVRPLRVLNL